MFSCVWAFCSESDLRLYLGFVRARCDASVVGPKLHRRQLLGSVGVALAEFSAATNARVAKGTVRAEAVLIGAGVHVT